MAMIEGKAKKNQNQPSAETASILGCYPINSEFDFNVDM
jgi:hypothetical protein